MRSQLKPPSPFDFYKSISQTKEDLFQTHPRADKVYNAYLVNWYLSHFADCIMAVNAVNSMYDLPKEVQYEYLLGSIAPKKRFFKWHKKEDDEPVKVIMKYYNYSERNAQQVVHLFSEKQIAELKKILESVGGEAS
jgi:hypothetical protein